MLASYRARRPIEFCCPGHRGGRHTDEETVALLGAGAYVHDVTQVPDIDDLLNPQGAIAEAQALAADLWGAQETHFLVNGTSSGIHAAFMAVCAPGDIVAVPRAVHRSVVEGLILSGAVPRWISSDVDPSLGCAVPPSPRALLEGAQGARMVVVTRPTYHGDVASLEWSRALHACGTILLVDEAWGAHLGLHPDLPPGACRSGADLVVNSTHKTAGALSGSSMLHRCSDRLDGEKLASAVRMLTTTSAWYGMLASLDGARRHLATRGYERLARIVEATRRAREELAAIKGVEVAGPARAEQFEGVADHDGTRLAFSPCGRGWTGSDLADAMREGHRIEVELADARSIVAQVSGEADVAALPLLVRSVGEAAPRVPVGRDEIPSCVIPPASMSPREAFHARHVRVPLEQALQRVAAEMVCPYPPGMPLVSYGERITEDVFERLVALRARRARVQGCGDAGLNTIRIVV